MDKIICVGKNYLEHAKELGDAIPEKPVLFLKPPSIAYFSKSFNETLLVELPRGRGSIHHECEILVRVNASGQINAVTLGLDMTLRDLQTQLKKNGHPWEISKTFLGAALIGPWMPVADCEDYLTQDFSFSVDGVLRQKGRGLEMRLSPVECIQYAADFFPLCEGDVIFTGTPAGVGPVQPGQKGELFWAGRRIFGVQWT